MGYVDDRPHGAKQMLNVVCLWVDRKYDVEYVNNLYAMVERNLALPHRFVCITDRPDDIGLHAGIETVATDTEVRGWWHKLTLFRPRPYGIEGQILFLDLDLAIVDSLDPFFLQVPGDLVMIRDFMKPGRWNSSVFRLCEGTRTKVWSSFDYKTHSKQFYGDQEWITYLLANEKPSLVETWPETWCVSYRLHNAQQCVPTGARIVVFHGQPKPHECAGWVQNAWRCASINHASGSTESDALCLESFVFRGQVRYRCPACSFDSYSTLEVVRHWSTMHRASQASPELGPILFGPDDKPIEREIRVPDGLPNFSPR